MARPRSRALRRVLAQNYPGPECLALDGGNTDGSIEVIRRSADRLSFWHSEVDGGQINAINRGLQTATDTVADV